MSIAVSKMLWRMAYEHPTRSNAERRKPPKYFCVSPNGAMGRLVRGALFTTPDTHFSAPAVTGPRALGDVLSDEIINLSEHNLSRSLLCPSWLRQEIHALGTRPSSCLWPVLHQLCVWCLASLAHRCLSCMAQYLSRSTVGCTLPWGEVGMGVAAHVLLAPTPEGTLKKRKTKAQWRKSEFLGYLQAASL